MHWLLIIIIVLALLAASMVSFRFGVGLLAGLVLLAIAAYFISGGGWRPGANRSADVVATDTKGVPAYAGSWRISSQLVNKSESATVKDLTLEVAALSCPTQSSDASECVTIDSIEHRLAVDIPPGATRNVTFTVAPQEFDSIDNSRWRITPVEVRTR